MNKPVYVERLLLALLLAVGCSEPRAAEPGAPDTPTQEADDAFGRRIGVESFGLYTESQVRGFNLQEAGNYRMNDAYFVRAAGPSDVILRSLQIKVGPSALDIDFPAPSGLVAYELLPDDNERTDIELGLQHLQDSNPRPYVRAFMTRRTADGRASISGGWIAADTARYIYGNEARYHGIGVVPRLVLDDRWQITTFASRYEQTYQADAGFIPARGVKLPELDRLHYIGQRWSQFDTRNENHGLIVSSVERDEAWDFSLSSILSRIDRPRSDFNIFRNVQADGTADAAVVVARDRRVSSWAHELAARRDWIDEGHRTELTLLGRYRDSEYDDPSTTTFAVGRVSLFDDPPAHAQPAAPTDVARSASALEQYELGLGLRRVYRSGVAANVGIRHVTVDETSRAADGMLTGRSSSSVLYNASVVAPIRGPLAAFIATTRGIEEAGTAPQNAANRYEVLAPVLARQSEIGLYWRSPGGVTAIATAFEIEKPEPGFDDNNEYRYLTTAQHRGVEASVAAAIAERSRIVLGALWMRPRLSGELVSSGEVMRRPLGRSSRVASISFEHQLAWPAGLSLDMDAAYTSAKLASVNGAETPGYVLANVGARYRFSIADAATTVRLRIYNATNEYAWYASSSGIQSYEPERRVMLSVAVGM